MMHGTNFSRGVDFAVLPSSTRAHVALPPTLATPRPAAEALARFIVLLDDQCVRVRDPLSLLCDARMPSVIGAETGTLFTDWR